MKKIYAAAFCCLILAPAHGLAADLGAFPSDSGSGGQQIVEIGTGWYIRGDIGVSLENLPTLSFNPGAIGAPPPASISPTAGTGSKTDAEFIGGLGVGYKFSNFIRGDITADYHSGSTMNSTTSGIICPYELDGIFSQNKNAVNGSPLGLGYLYSNTNTCNAGFQLKQQNYTSLANLYFDLFTYSGFTPYVGAGAGINVQTESASLNYAQSSNGAPYRANLTVSGTQNYPFVWVNAAGTPISPQPAIAFAQQNWDRSYKTTNTNFAWALMGGVGVALTQNAMLDLSYRYLDMGSTSYTFNPQTGATVSHRNTAQEARIGIRYTPD